MKKRRSSSSACLDVTSIPEHHHFPVPRREFAIAITFRHVRRQPRQFHSDSRQHPLAWGKKLQLAARLQQWPSMRFPLLGQTRRERLHASCRHGRGDGGGKQRASVSGGRSGAAMAAEQRYAWRGRTWNSLLCSCSALCPWGYGGNGRLGGIPLFFSLLFTCFTLLLIFQF